jgi:putative DNA primase/helicase
VLVGSSNRSDWLNDPTGGRRFLPVSCLTERIDVGRVARARDQLWAEATQRYQAGEAGWWDVPDAQPEQMARYNEDPWHDPIKQWLETRTVASTAEILEFCLRVELARQTRSDQIRVGNVMLVLGWERRRVRDGNALSWQYFRKEG